VAKANNLLVKEPRELRARRESLPSKPKTIKTNQIWGTDMTKVKLPYIGWTYIVIVLDCHAKKIVGYSLSTRSKTNDIRNVGRQMQQLSSIE
jgi:transposase InsO family protein